MTGFPLLDHRLTLTGATGVAAPASVPLVLTFDVETLGAGPGGGTLSAQVPSGFAVRIRPGEPGWIDSDVTCIERAPTR